MTTAKTIGYITQEIIALLALGIVPQPIFWGESNREHIKVNHPATYVKYASMLAAVITDVLKVPDYAGKRNDAIEYIKIMSDGEILKVAVRTSKKGIYFARTMYPISQDELNSFLAKKTLLKVD
jgi:hypothetical protein